MRTVKSISNLLVYSVFCKRETSTLKMLFHKSCGNLLDFRGGVDLNIDSINTKVGISIGLILAR